MYSTKEHLFRTEFILGGRVRRIILIAAILDRLKTFPDEKLVDSQRQRDAAQFKRYRHFQVLQTDTPLYKFAAKRIIGVRTAAPHAERTAVGRACGEKNEQAL